MPDDLSKVFRPPEKCDFCYDVNKVVRISNISPKEFEEKFAYTGVPVIVTDATQNWTALEVKQKNTPKSFKKKLIYNCNYFRFLIFGILKIFI